jgi:hypothetical protein
MSEKSKIAVRFPIKQSEIIKIIIKLLWLEFFVRMLDKSKQMQT